MQQDADSIPSGGRQHDNHAKREWIARSCVVLEPAHAEKQHAREPGDTPAPTLEQIMNGLIREVRFGKIALRIAAALNTVDPDIWNAAPLFSGVSRQANLEVAQMHLARLYDRPTKYKTPVTVRALLDLAETHPALFTEGEPGEVIAAAKECRAIITA